ncbi:MAG: lipopolysaccharide biosynthesis protein [Acidobacteria bacterium]|nr:lipopolysaccharide biosynthesis protein [Acidobacteriota bacterium]
MLRFIAVTTSARLVGAVLSLLVVMLTARWLGPDGRGQVAAAVTWAQLLATFGHLSLGQVALHRASTADGRAWFPQAWKTLTRAAGGAWLVATGLTFALLAVGSETFGDVPPPVVAASLLLVPGLVWEQQGGGLLMAINRLDLQNRAVIVGRVVTLGVVSAVMAMGGRAGAVVVALAAGQAVVSAGGIRVLRARRAAGPPALAPTAGASYLRDAAVLHLNAVGTFLALWASVLIVNRFCGTADAAFFQMAVQLVGLLLLLPNAAASVFYGGLAATGARCAWESQRRMVGGLTALMAAAALLSMVFARPVVVLLGGEAFAPAVPLFRGLAFAVPAMTLGTLMAPQWIGRGLFGAAAAVTLAGGVLSTALSAWLVARWGDPQGATVSFVTTYSLFALANAWLVWRCERDRRGRPST